ncbi:venom acid phosphatase Acph-1 isoform X1 [Nasonia vitripennis]|uniref:acid phosphatase n=1 Tax=Nasonia vitripennis TaxID=7425 RepID=A0A7M7QXG9_NASVI|nr:venom acid phosphatase Acph-1 isoform X1 [Nasonia vitripennis]XP_031785786.1 venom acid phosphatase Acph-1 isoform X1 [Nasonia vitripennis]XP_032455059.1 venom acid phosphatase Acph-1 isoform X1 [Nasonia vitripennis]XP_032455060.1 venom acid phosphatase Acph-1 isoform X1 [Nasonia vitripennis]XP_032455061.1 venom acid phosphatase Acph-1 isoform X1 [Nasonia vitripennis]
MSKLWSLLNLLVVWASAALAFDRVDTLQAVGVAFRHGDRIPQPYPIGFYPTDPHKNRTFAPIGSSGLTNRGKRREYRIGTTLRSRYNGFLDENYIGSDVAALSTDNERTRMSLQLVLAGLYPPKDQQVWSDDVKWQPIPVDNLISDLASFTWAEKCPTRAKIYKELLESEDYKKDFGRFKEVMDKLSTLTGRNLQTAEEVYHLFHTLTAETAMGLTLPEWTKEYYPHGPIINITLFQYLTDNYNTPLKRLNGGLFLRKMLNDLGVNKDGKVEKKAKINLYSGHENNIGALLYALKVWKNVIPAYSSAVILELHKKGSQYFIKVVYYKGIPEEFEDQTIPGCSEYCPLEDFLRIVKDVLPDDIMDACFGPPEDSQLIPKSLNPVVWIYEKIRSWFYL